MPVKSQSQKRENRVRLQCAMCGLVRVRFAWCDTVATTL